MATVSKLVGLTGWALLALAHPAELDAKQILSRRGVDIEPFRLASAAKYIGIKDPKPDIHGPASPPSAGTYVESASALVKSVHPDVEYRVVDDHYVGSNGIAHVRFKQTIHGIDVDNGDFNVNVSLVPVRPLTKRNLGWPLTYHFALTIMT